MPKHWTRREFIASVSVSALGPVLAASDRTSAVAAPDRNVDGKHVTLLHFTDTHAQLETHPEYLPGATPEIQMMGGYARLKTAIERERAHCEGPASCLTEAMSFKVRARPHGPKGK